VPQIPTISWKPAPLVFGTPLGAAQLDAQSNAPGVMVYNPPAGTMLNAGTQTLSLVFNSAVTGYSNTTATATVVVSPGPQTVTFAAIPAHTGNDPPFALAASSSSGLAVSFSVLSGPATITGNTLTVTGIGTVVIQASQAGGGNYAPAIPVQQTFSVGLGPVTVATVRNAASNGGGLLASDSFIAIKGAGFSTDTVVAPSVLFPTEMAGVTVAITDSSGTTKNGLLYYVSPTQINLVVPEGLAPGAATVTVNNATGQAGVFAAVIGEISPALFTADSSGTGSVAGVAISYPGDGSYQVLCATSPACSAVAIDLGPSGTSVYLSLYGTGIRHLSGLSGVTVMADGVPLQVSYAGKQDTYPGLDQVNVLLDRSLIGKGVVNLQMTIDGVSANPVQINIR
jgi:uncharacterized protein (TIGR03437 family)